MAIIFIAGMACKKSALSVAQRLQAKWLVDKEISNSHYGGADHTATYTGLATDYVDFRSNNKVYSQVSGSKDTSNYSVVNDSTMTIDVDTYKILTLTDNIFKIYSKSFTTPVIWDETTINLKK